MTIPWYVEVKSNVPITQGDIFANIHVYTVNPKSAISLDETPTVEHFEAPAIVLTQACDLENDPKPDRVVVALLSPIKEHSWNFVSEVLSYKRPALHMLEEYKSVNITFPYHLIDFGDLHTIPYSVLDAARLSFGRRLRLNSPYLEKVAQRFGSYFSRIGLPIDINKENAKRHIQSKST